MKRIALNHSQAFWLCGLSVAAGYIAAIVGTGELDKHIPHLFAQAWTEIGAGWAAAIGAFAAVAVALGLSTREAIQRRDERREKANLALTLLLPHFHVCRGAIVAAKGGKLSNLSHDLSPKDIARYQAACRKITRCTKAMQRWAFELDGPHANQVTAAITLSRQIAWQVNRAIEDDGLGSITRMALGPQIQHAATQALSILDPLCEDAERHVTTITGQPFWGSNHDENDPEEEEDEHGGSPSNN